MPLCFIYLCRYKKKILYIFEIIIWKLTISVLYFIWVGKYCVFSWANQYLKNIKQLVYYICTLCQKCHNKCIFFIIKLKHSNINFYHFYPNSMEKEWYIADISWLLFHLIWKKNKGQNRDFEQKIVFFTINMYNTSKQHFLSKFQCRK